MLAIIWRFDVRPECVEEFETHYGSDGEWASLFELLPGFVGLNLVRDHDYLYRYYTMDFWKDRQSFENFQTSRAKDGAFRERYEQLDAMFECLTVDESSLAVHETDTTNLDISVLRNLTHLNVRPGELRNG